MPCGLNYVVCFFFNFGHQSFKFCNFTLLSCINIVFCLQFFILNYLACAELWETFKDKLSFDFSESEFNWVEKITSIFNKNKNKCTWGSSSVVNREACLAPVPSSILYVHACHPRSVLYVSWAYRMFGEPWD